MEALPREIVRVLRVCEDIFSERVWDWAQVQVVGAILSPGQRTVAAVLGALRRSEERQFQNYPRAPPRAPHKTIPALGRQMIRQVGRWLPDRALVVVADSTYAALELLADAAGLPQPVTMVARLRLDAALYDPAPPREPGTKGRPRLKGERQPTLATRVLDPDTTWEPLTVPWYGGGTAQVEVATGTARRYHPGGPTVPLRCV